MAESDLYKDDLYGDLDLEDLDASQLEELVEPPELEPIANKTTDAPIVKQEQPATSAIKQEPNQTQYNINQQQQLNDQSQGAQYAFGQGQTHEDNRIRPSDMPDEGKMFIGGLNWETTEDGLKAYMSQFGTIDLCTIMRDQNGRSRGFAFLTYSDAAAVTKVMGQTHHLDGKQIDPKRAIPRAEHERTAKVFVGGLAAGVTSESLKTFLTQFGQVMDATVMFDKETGRSKGFAFATFAEEESVGIAMAASGIELEGKPIEIKKAQPRGAGTQPGKFAQPQQGGRFGQQQGGFGGPVGGNMNMGNMGMGMGMGMGMPGGSTGGGGGFDPSAMAMMYQNMMKPNAGMGGMMGGFDPNAMAMMYSNMMKSMAGGSGAGGNAPAINPNMAMRNGGMGMGMGNMGMGGMGGMGMGGMGNMMGMGGMGNMSMGMGGAGVNRGAGTRPVPNAPRGPAAMRNANSGPGGGAGTGAGAGGEGGPGAQRYSTQGAARSRPY